MPISYINNRNEVVIELIPDNGVGKAMRVSSRRRGIILSTNRKDQEHLIDVYNNIAQRDIEQITYAVSKGMDSMDDRVLISRSALKELTKGNGKKPLLIEEE